MAMPLTLIRNSRPRGRRGPAGSIAWSGPRRPSSPPPPNEALPRRAGGARHPHSPLTRGSAEAPRISD